MIDTAPKNGQRELVAKELVVPRTPSPTSLSPSSSRSPNMVKRHDFAKLVSPLETKTQVSTSSSTTVHLPAARDTDENLEDEGLEWGPGGALKVKRLLSKVTWRLMPFLMILYVFSFLDRANLGNAHQRMIKDLGLTEEQYGQASAIFFLPYAIFEVPSNMMLEIINARRWISRIMVTWGAISTAMCAVNSFTALMIGRFFLGMSEAGFFPGIVYYLTKWFTPAERAQRLAVFYAAQPVAGLLGGLAAYGILSLDGVGGLKGWQWLFILEGAPTVLLGFITFWYLPDGPQDASWLSDDEKSFLYRRSLPHTQLRELSHLSPSSTDPDLAAADGSMQDSSAPVGAATQTHSHKLTKALLMETFGSGSTWVLGTLNFLMLLPIYSVSFFLPAIISEFGVGALMGNLLSAVPYTIATVFMMLNSRHSDYTAERLWHILGCNALASVGFIAMAASASMRGTGAVVLKMAVVSVIASGVWGSKPVYMAWVTSSVRGNLAIGIAFVVTFGNFAGLVGPLVLAETRAKSGTYTLGLLLLLGVQVIASLLIAALPQVIAREEKRKGYTAVVDRQTLLRS